MTMSSTSAVISSLKITQHVTINVKNELEFSHNKTIVATNISVGSGVCYTLYDNWTVVYMPTVSSFLIYQMHMHCTESVWHVSSST